jgi:hypothetical protein
MSSGADSATTVHIDMCLPDQRELHGVLVGPDGIPRPFSGWTQLVSELERQRASAHCDSRVRHG